MTEAQKKYLFDLYTTHTIDEIDANFGPEISKKMGKDNYSQLKDENDFNTRNLLLKNCKSELNKILITDDQKTQVCDIIDDLYAKRNHMKEEDYQVCLEFYKVTIYERWEPKFKEPFDFAEKQLIRRKHVFISYTNRNAFLNNSLYIELIDKFLDSEIRDNETSRNKKNLIVWVIKQYLIDTNQLTGYFDQDKYDYEYGRNLPDLLQQYCEDSFTFLQLLEKRTFDKADDTIRNYCFDEFNFFSTGYQPIYKAIMEGQPENLFIIRSLTVLKDKPEAVFPINFPDDFNAWRNRVNPITFLKLYWKMPIYEFVNELEVITENIKNRVEQILNNYKENIKKII